MELKVRDVPEMYTEMMRLMKMRAFVEDSRNGGVLSLREPLTVTVTHPATRINVDPIRRCNPFFHVMEFVWMMSGSNSPMWISTFNKRFVEYADWDHRTEPTIHGAYGNRWRSHFDVDQIVTAVGMLQEDPTSRRVVLSMWDAYTDLGTAHNDLPCNTHVYLRILNGALDMTVCNRSNDVIWGMTGANAVHMTMLQELMANAIGCEVGVYRVFTNNAHVYTDLPNVGKMLDTTAVYYPSNDGVTPIKYEGFPLLQPHENIVSFLEDCESFIEGSTITRSYWLNAVASPMYELWFNRELDTDYILDKGWAAACAQWLRP